MKNIEPSSNFKELLNLLHDINEVDVSDDFFYLQLYSGEYKYEEYHFLRDDDWLQNDLSTQFGDRFIEFSGETDGSKFCLWFYDGLVGEPPIVYFGSDANFVTIAPSMSEFICLLINCDIPDGYEKKPKNIWYKLDKESIAELKEDEPKVYAGFMKRKEIASTMITCDKHKNIIKNFKKHPKFHKWIKEVNQIDEQT